MIRVFKNTDYYKKRSDEDLIDLFRSNGNKEFIGVLFSRYTHLVFGVCMKYLKNEAEAEDATMEIFEDLIEKLGKHEVENFNSWIYSVSRNKCLMILRAKKCHDEKKGKIYENYYAENVEMNNEWHLFNENEGPTIKTKLERAILELKKEQQHCIQLMYIENRSYKEISVLTGYSLKNVKSYIQNGKRKLKLLLENR